MIRYGARPVSSATIIAALGYTPVNKAGDTMTGTLTGTVFRATSSLQFGGAGDVVLNRDAADILGQRAGTNSQMFNVYKTFTDSSNYQRLQLEANQARIITNWAGTGTPYDLILGSGASHWSISSSGGHLTSVLGTSDIRWGTNNTFPMLRRASTTIAVRLADNSAYGYIEGRLRADNVYAAGVISPTGSIIIYDNTGTGYKIPVVLA